MLDNILGIIFLPLVLAACIWWYLFIKKKERAKALLLKGAYDKAIAAGDRKAALEAGRAYYSSLRDGKLTIYDEQAIANDLATIGK